MTIQEIYQAFDAIGCLSFTTVTDKQEPESRIAHLRGFDEDGIYFMTMHTKTFYHHLKHNPNVSICGLCADTKVGHDNEGMPTFQSGYSIRLTGVAREVSMASIKAKENPMFDLCIKDQEKYPAMVVFCIESGRGDIFDYDFELETRENKLQRTYFSYNGGSISYRGLHIQEDTCISCGKCKENCSFVAIKNEENKYIIDEHRCDECGDCMIVCPVGAIKTGF